MEAQRSTQEQMGIETDPAEARRGYLKQPKQHGCKAIQGPTAMPRIGPQGHVTLECGRARLF